MAITFGKLEGRITIPTGGVVVGTFQDDLGGPTAVTLSAGTYYWSSVGSGANDLPAQLAVDVNAAMGETWGVTVSAGEGGTGRVTITCSGSAANTNVVWNAATIRNLFGFDANITTDNNATGADHAEGLWLPDCPPSTPYAYGGEEGWTETDWSSVESSAGHVSTLVYRRKTVNQVVWDAISHARARIAAESITGESYQQFERDVIWAEHTYCTGTPIRWYPDADTDGTYVTYRATNATESHPQPSTPGWRGLWRIETPRMVVVP